MFERRIQRETLRSAAMRIIPDKLRMLVWLLCGLALYWCAALVGQESPAVQTVFYKLGHVTTLAWFGYWISRNAIGRVADDSSPNEKLARAVLIAGVILAGSMGL